MIREDLKEIDHNPLRNLSDVAISTPVNGQALVYDSVTNTWVNSSSVGGMPTEGRITFVASGTPIEIL